MYVGDEFDIDAVASKAPGLRGVWCERVGNWPSVPEQEVTDARVDRVKSLTSVVDILL